MYVETSCALKSLLNLPERRFPFDHLSIISDLDTALSASRYPGVDSLLRTTEWGSQSVCDHDGSQSCVAGHRRIAVGFSSSDADACVIRKACGLFRTLYTFACLGTMDAVLQCARLSQLGQKLIQPLCVVLTGSNQTGHLRSRYLFAHIKTHSVSLSSLKKKKGE